MNKERSKNRKQVAEETKETKETPSAERGRNGSKPHSEVAFRLPFFASFKSIKHNSKCTSTQLQYSSTNSYGIFTHALTHSRTQSFIHSVTVGVFAGWLARSMTTAAETAARIIVVVGRRRRAIVVVVVAVVAAVVCCAAVGCCCCVVALLPTT